MPSKRDGQITLPLLERLTDHEPKNSHEVALTRSQALRELKSAVRRNLEWLLNTRRLQAGPDVPKIVADSVLFYGLPEFSKPGDDRDTLFENLALQIQTAVENFEPRLENPKVFPSPYQDDTRRKVGLVIEGMLRIDPGLERISFDTMLELTSGEYQVKGEPGGG